MRLAKPADRDQVVTPWSSNRAAKSEAVVSASSVKKGGPGCDKLLAELSLTQPEAASQASPDHPLSQPGSCATSEEGSSQALAGCDELADWHCAAWRHRVEAIAAKPAWRDLVHGQNDQNQTIGRTGAGQRQRPNSNSVNDTQRRGLLIVERCPAKSFGRAQPL